MFTQNYIDLTKARFQGLAEQNVVDWEGQTRKVQLLYNNYYSYPGYLLKYAATSTSKPTTYDSSLSYSSPHFGVRFGTGSTPATKADWDLENPMFSGLNISANTLVVSEEAPGKYAAHNTFVVTNTTDAEINISEVGMYAPVNIMQDASTKRFYYALMERTVLDVPINIQPGASKVVTYKVTINQS